MALVPSSVLRYTSNLVIPIYKYAAAHWHEALNSFADLVDAAVAADRGRLSTIEVVVKPDGVVLGGVKKTAWDIGNGGTGAVVLSGGVILAGQDGVTVSHNLGHTQYQVKLTALDRADRVGDFWVTKAANTLVVYNTGEPRLSASIEISNDAGMSTPSVWRWTHPGELEVLGVTLLKNQVDVMALRPDADGTRNLGESGRRWANGHFTGLTLGGVNRASWPTATTGANGNVVLSGAVTLGGLGGVTLIHNKGDTNYLVKILPTGSVAGDVGEISYVKAANTVTIYNSGRSGNPADFELSAIA